MNNTDDPIPHVGPLVDPNPGPVAQSPPDPFDPETLRLSPEEMYQEAGLKKILTTVPVRKPSNDEYFRTLQGERHTIVAGFIELKSDNEIYLVAADMCGAVADESTFSYRKLFTAISRQGVCFLLPVRMPDRNGSIDSWNASRMEAATLAQHQWVRMASNRSLGAYEITVATAKISEPVWPDKSLRDLLAIAFKDRLIDCDDHPVLRRLRGEI